MYQLYNEGDFPKYGNDDKVDSIVVEIVKTFMNFKEEKALQECYTQHPY